LRAKIGAFLQLDLSFDPAPISLSRMAEVTHAPRFEGRQISAPRSRLTAVRVAEDFDVTISLIGVGTLLAR